MIWVPSKVVGDSLWRSPKLPQNILLGILQDEVRNGNFNLNFKDFQLKLSIRKLFNFPEQQLANIVNAHFYQSSEKLIEAAVKRFRELRSQMEKGKAGKKASTSELLDWFAVLQQFPEDKILHELETKIPFPEVLLKKWEDHLRYLNYEA